MTLLSVSTIGWIATALSGFGTISPLPLAYRVRNRGFLDGENVDPWIMMIVYDASVCIYAFNEKTGTGLPLKVWCLSDIIVSSFLALTALKFTKDDKVFDQYTKLIWSCGITIPIILLFINLTNLLGLWMLIVCFSNASSVFSSLGRVFRNGIDEHAKRAFDPLMLFCRLFAGTAWSVYAYMDDDMFVLGCSVWSTFCPLASLCVYGMVAAQAKAIALKEAIILEYKKRKTVAPMHVVSKTVFTEVRVINVMSSSVSSGLVSDLGAEIGAHRDMHLSNMGIYPSMNPTAGSTMECSICITSIRFANTESGEDPLDITPVATARAADEDDVENGSSVQNAITLHCGHCFCSKCLQRCSEVDMKTCPVCRKEHELSPEVLKARLTDYRSKYQNWRKGGAKGAKGEVDDISAC